MNKHTIFNAKNSTKQSAKYSTILSLRLPIIGTKFNKTSSTSF